MARESLNKLYVQQLRDLSSAEEQILEALPKMIKHIKHAECSACKSRRSGCSARSMRKGTRITS